MFEHVKMLISVQNCQLSSRFFDFFHFFLYILNNMQYTHLWNSQFIFNDVILCVLLLNILCVTLCRCAFYCDGVFQCFMTQIRRNWLCCNQCKTHFWKKVFRMAKNNSTYCISQYETSKSCYNLSCVWIILSVQEKYLMQVIIPPLNAKLGYKWQTTFSQRWL